VVRRHQVHDEGSEEFRDISAFSPIDDDADEFGEGVEVAGHDEPEAAVAEADRHGGAIDRWVNEGMAADDYWRARTSA
jgi:hypothetical protein